MVVAQELLFAGAHRSCVGGAFGLLQHKAKGQMPCAFLANALLHKPSAFTNSSRALWDLRDYVGIRQVCVLATQVRFCICDPW